MWSNGLFLESLCVCNLGPSASCNTSFGVTDAENASLLAHHAEEGLSITSVGVTDAEKVGHVLVKS